MGSSLRRLTSIGLTAAALAFFSTAPAWAGSPPDAAVTPAPSVVERTAPAEPLGGPGVLSNGADCQGCYAWASINEYSSWPGVKVRAKTRNYASEIIDRQEAHLALVAGSACYQGDYKYTGGTGYEYNREDGSLVDSGWKYGGHGWWTNANGHEWLDDGATWTVSGGADVCRQY